MVSPAHQEMISALSRYSSYVVYAQTPEQFFELIEGEKTRSIRIVMSDHFHSFHDNATLAILNNYNYPHPIYIYTQHLRSAAQMFASHGGKVSISDHAHFLVSQLVMGFNLS